MKTITLLFIFIISCIIFSYGQTEMGKWRMPLSSSLGKKVIYADGVVYGIVENGVVEYDEEEEEIFVWTNADFLSDVSPTALAYDSKTKNVIIGYENGNIDLLRNGKIYNFPVIKQAEINGLKKVTDIQVRNGLAYVSTGIGVVVVDIKKREVRDTYYPTYEDKAIVEVTFLKDSIYALAKDAIYVGVINNPFLADASQWYEKKGIPNYSSLGTFTHIEAFHDDLFLSFKPHSGEDTLYRIQGDNSEVFLANLSFFELKSDRGEFIITTWGKVLIYNSQLELINDIWGYIYPDYGVQLYAEPKGACKAKKGYYIADGQLGINWSSTPFNSKGIGFKGPKFNDAFRAKWRNGTLAIACGSPGMYSKKGGSTIIEEEWGAVYIYEQDKIKDKNIWDFSCVAINPNSPEEVAFGTTSTIPVVITKNNKVKDTFSVFNSNLEPVTETNWSFVRDLEYDDEGNLWVLNSEVSSPLKVRAKNGVWYDFDMGSSVKNKVCNRLLIDQNGVKWITIEGIGIGAFDDNGTISKTGDDRYQIFTTNPKGGDLPSAKVHTIASDFDNNIWIGTEEGMRVLYNTEGIFDASPGQYNFQKLLIEYGENVEIVLGTTEITSIQIDGANRKWVGTASSGVFLLSPDGMEIIRNFTSENSPLLNNSILDIAINHNSGEVYFLTESGLIIYRSDASQGDDDYTEVKVFPNPVHPEFNGMITIQGIAYNSDVKITDASGRLVYKTHSNGGTATWNGRTLTGDRVPTGVYLIWTSIDSEDYKGRKVGKVLIIN